MGFQITVAKGGRAHLQADARLQPDDFRAIEAKLQRPAIRARKIGYVAAREANRREVVEHHWNGKETTNTAKRGYVIVTSLSPKQEVLRDRDGSVNTYVVPAARFPSLYEAAEGHNEHGAIFRAKSVVDAIDLPGGFDIMA